MGNRAVITTRKAGVNPANSDATGVYLHWNGGRDSVEAFLAYCKLKQVITSEAVSALALALVALLIVTTSTTELTLSQIGRLSAEPTSRAENRTNTISMKC